MTMDSHEFTSAGGSSDSFIRPSILSKPTSSPPRPNSLHGPPKKVILSLETQASSNSLMTRSNSLHDSAQPIKARIVYVVTAAIFACSFLGFTVTIIGLFFSWLGVEYLVCGAVVAILSLIVACVVRWAGHPLSHTALLQGYLLVGALCSLSCIIQVFLVILLVTLPPYPDFYNQWPWVQFFGGVQMAGLTMLVVVIAAGGTVMILCGAKRTPVNRDTSVHAAYDPR